MATTARVSLTDEQRQQLAEDFRIRVESVPLEIAVVGIAPEAGEHLGFKRREVAQFSPALIIT